MDMEMHMLIYFFISMLVDRGKKWDSYKNGNIYWERWEIVIKKVHRKMKQLLNKKEK
jgi:hypothetical protein